MGVAAISMEVRSDPYQKHFRVSGVHCDEDQIQVYLTMTSPEYLKTINSIRKSAGISGPIRGVHNGHAACFVNGAHRAGFSVERLAGHPPTMMMNVLPQRSDPSGMSRIVRLAGAAPLPPSASRKDVHPSFGFMNFMCQTAITANIAPHPTMMTNVAPQQSDQSGTSRIV
jgi:hypothetical protein